MNKQKTAGRSHSLTLTDTRRPVNAPTDSRERVAPSAQPERSYVDWLERALSVFPPTASMQPPVPASSVAPSLPDDEDDSTYRDNATGEAMKKYEQAYSTCAGSEPHSSDLFVYVAPQFHIPIIYRS